ncbi:MAG TPA: hypothetical protein V6D22_03855 [Candidatus Obscuribacterales bacterium]
MRNFNTETAKWVVANGYGTIVKAGDLTDEHVGRGLLHEIWRDHEWQYISRIERTADDKIEIEHLEGISSKNETKEGDTTTVITEYRVKKVVETYEPDADICIEIGNESKRPRSERIIEKTTRTVTSEPIED